MILHPTVKYTILVNWSIRVTKVFVFTVDIKVIVIVTLLTKYDSFVPPLSAIFSPRVTFPLICSKNGRDI